jgi:hypothetical protein
MHAHFKSLTVSQADIKQLTLALELADFIRDNVKLALKAIHHAVNFLENFIRSLELLV